MKLPAAGALLRVHVSVSYSRGKSCMAEPQAAGLSARSSRARRTPSQALTPRSPERRRYLQGVARRLPDNMVCANRPSLASRLVREGNMGLTAAAQHIRRAWSSTMPAQGGPSSWAGSKLPPFSLLRFSASSSVPSTGTAMSPSGLLLVCVFSSPSFSICTTALL